MFKTVKKIVNNTNTQTETCNRYTKQHTGKLKKKIIKMGLSTHVHMCANTIYFKEITNVHSKIFLKHRTYVNWSFYKNSVMLLFQTGILFFLI